MKIVYWSGTGNTEVMADLIKSGIESAGKAAEVINVASATPDVFEGEEIIILGCPSMGSETLEESEFEPFVESIASKISGKKIALFGSYGWGDGQWMRDWEDRMKGYGGELIGEGLTVNEAPDGDTAEECEEFGRKIAN
ncbi:MAG: flavodoxin [Clostridioides sp.]|nr:flavodoxin [Clostridioides sp.]